MKVTRFVFVMLGLWFSSSALAANCSVDVDATDAMSFSVKNIDVSKSCKEFTINLKHTGTMAKTIMGHNIVIAKAADQQGVLADASTAGPANDYVKANDSRVVAHTKLIGGGEKDTVKFPVSKLTAGQNYVFFCSFPGHATMMKGTVKLVN
jgi:azurin